MKAIWGILSGVFCSCLLSYPTYAEIAVVPESLTISTKRNTSVSKTLRLSTDNDIQAIEVVPSDLDRADHSAALSAKAVKVNLSKQQLTANEAVPIEVTIDSSQFPGSGEFSGSLLIRYDGGQRPVPFTVQIKDSIWLPFIVLVVGVGLGSSVSGYRSSGLRRDELVVRLSHLRTQMRGEEQSQANRFKQRIEDYLVEVETALNDKTWEVANAKFLEAQDIWTQWRKGREDWISLINYQKKLVEEVEQSSMQDKFYGQFIQTHLEDVERQVTYYGAPQRLFDRLNELRWQIERYAQGQTWLEKIAIHETELVEDRRPFWEDRRTMLEQRLNSLSPEVVKAFEQWRDLAEKELTTLLAELEQQNASTAMQDETAILETENNVEAGGTLQIFQPQRLPPIPSVKRYSEQVKAPTSTLKPQLQWFRWISRGVAIALLSWVGMNELYGRKPTFGAAPMSDYFILLAWGFGAEATRETVVKAVQDLSGPLGSSGKA
ncbi:MAG: hypothetical protein QNJ46_15375 [Leptolyngbyaceae cyanobacterium MO_188.B28]|nr:hypothetical protein [Leptolyngbyaceae cyanobacterium MO_188.B28]